MAENPIYCAPHPNNAAEPGASNPLYAKAISLPEEDDIATAKKKNKDHTYMEPKDATPGEASKHHYEKPLAMRVSHTNKTYTEPKDVTPGGVSNHRYEKPLTARVSHANNTYTDSTDVIAGGASNPCYVKSPPVRVSRANKSGDHQEDERAPGKDLDAYLKGAKAKVRASNASQTKKFKRQRSSEKAATEEENHSLRRNEVPPSFDNPFYSDNCSRDQENFNEDPTYATIPALQDGRPCLPPRTLQRSYETSAESIELHEDDTYEQVNFGDTDA